jgi:hypothetical protein
MATRLEIVSEENPHVTVDEARTFCRLFDPSHDATLRLLVDAATEFIEGQLRESLRVRTYRLTATAGEITAGLVLPKWPVIQLTALTVNGAVQSLAGIGVDQFQWPAKLTGVIPTGTTQVLEWRAGYLSLASTRKLLILQMVADWRANPEASAVSPLGNELSIGTKLLLEGENQHIDAVRG